MTTKRTINNNKTGSAYVIKEHATRKSSEGQMKASHRSQKKASSYVVRNFSETNKQKHRMIS